MFLKKIALGFLVIGTYCLPTLGQRESRYFNSAMGFCPFPHENVNLDLFNTRNMVVKEIKTNKNASTEEIGMLLDNHCANNSIAILNWEEFSYIPKVGFKIAHNGTEILLKYTVSEKYTMARETKTNGNVYKDSCVEFFISFDQTNYYNLEFNGIGTRHVAYGPGRNGRKFVDSKILEGITIKSSLGDKPFDEKAGLGKWEITMVIPVSCFAFSTIDSLNGVKATANFYKCGDETSLPHFVTWSPIDTPNPDYHRPEFFGELWFE